jgi:hypothetical protein
MNLYALEQHIIGCWNICDDIETLEEQGASMADMTALSTIYKYKFQKLWDEYETLLAQHASLEKGLAKRECLRCGKQVGDDVHTCTPKVRMTPSASAGWVD